MMETNSSDNFEYILQLTRLLSGECRSSRQQTESMGTLLARIAKQSGVSYENYSRGVSPSTNSKYKNYSELSEVDRLISDNYKLIYQIEQQEYINKKIWTLINHINEHINSIKIFLMEQRILPSSRFNEILNEKIDIHSDFINENITVLKESENVIELRNKNLVKKIANILENLDSSSINKDSKDYLNFKDSVHFLGETYDIKFTIPSA